MIANKTECKILQSVTFLLWKYIEEAFATFVATLFVIFVDHMQLLKCQQYFLNT